MDVMRYDGPLVTHQDEELGWCSVRKHEDYHEGRAGVRPRSDGVGLEVYDTSRITNADVEGTASEVLAAAVAVLAGDSLRRKRIAVEHVEDGVQFWSPRNSLIRALVPRDRAREWAEATVEALGGDDE